MASPRVQHSLAVGSATCALMQIKLWKTKKKPKAAAGQQNHKRKPKASTPDGKVWFYRFCRAGATGASRIQVRSVRETSNVSEVWCFSITTKSHLLVGQLDVLEGQTGVAFGGYLVFDAFLSWKSLYVGFLWVLAVIWARGRVIASGTTETRKVTHQHSNIVRLFKQHRATTSTKPAGSKIMLAMASQVTLVASICSNSH